MTRYKWFSVMLVLGAVFANGTPPTESLDFTKWKRVTSQPYPMAPLAATSCIQVLCEHRGPNVPPRGSSKAGLQEIPVSEQVIVAPGKTQTVPFGTRWCHVYVNPIGLKAFTSSAPDLPAGSVVVKSKLKTPLDKTPELSTVMIKHEKGYSAKSRDWEYAILDASGRRIKSDTDHCVSCHQDAYKTGGSMLFRTYLKQHNGKIQRGTGSSY